MHTTRLLGVMILALATAAHLSGGAGAEATASAVVVLNPAPAAAGTAPVKLIPSDTLHDVAVAEYSDAGSVIHYNPAALRRLGPAVSAFLMAHEYGHIHLHHTRANALLAGRTALDSVLQGRELEADCYAADSLGREDPAVVVAAARFFGRLSSVQFDAAHPAGPQRAVRILSCLPPASGERPDSVAVAHSPDVSGRSSVR